MNALIPLLNQTGERLLSCFWPVFWQSSLVIVVLLSLDLVLRRHVRAVVRHALLLLILVKLLLPPSFASPTSPAYWLLPSEPVPVRPVSSTIVTHSEEVTLPVMSTPPDRFSPPAVELPRPGLSQEGWLTLGWFVIGLTLMGCLGWRAMFVRLRKQRGIAPAGELLQLLEDAARTVFDSGFATEGGRSGPRRIRLLLCDDGGSPVVCGLLRPTILLPCRLVGCLNATQLRAVLLHEAAHIKRGDVWVNCLQVLLQIIYWWHPLVWLANARIRRVCEEAVDEVVQVALGREAEVYPATLLEVARNILGQPRPGLGLVGIAEPKSALSHRIKRMIERPVPRSARLNITSLAAVGLCAALLLPMARGQQRADGGVEPPPESPPMVVNVKFECIEVDEADALAIWEASLDQNLTVGENWSARLTETQLKSLKSNSSVKVASALNVTTLSGRQAFARAGESPEVFASTNKSIGSIQHATLDVMPTVESNGTWVAIGLRAEVGGFAGYDDADAFRPDNPPANGRVLPLPRFSSLRFNSDARVRDGQTLLLGNPLDPKGDSVESPGDGKRRLLVFITPTIIDSTGNRPGNASTPTPPRVIVPAPYPIRTIGEPVAEPPDSASSSSAPTNALPLVNDTNSSNSEPGHHANGRERIAFKLDHIRLDEVTFDRIPLSEVIKHLAESARNGDPEGEGVNFIINPNVDPPVNGSTNIEPVEVNSIGINIHPAMVDVRLADVMDAIVQVASPPIKYSIEDYAVVFSLRTEHATPLYTRWFRLDIGKLCQRLMSKGLLDAGALDSLTESPDEGSFAVPIGAAPDGARFRYVTSTNDLSLIGGATRVFIQSAGVDLNPPKAMFLSMGQGHLLVRATLQDLDVVETALQNLDPLPREANKSKRPPVVPPGPDTTRADTNSASFTPMPSVATHAVHDSQSTLTIQVLRDGSYVLGTNKMDLPVLRQHVFEIKTLSLDKRARISADQDAPFSAVVAVMNLLKESNISAVIAGIQVPVVGRTEQSDATVCTRIFKVEPHSFARGLEGILGTPAVSSVQEAIRSALSLAGVKVNPPNSIFYNDSAGTILVRATPRELDIVEQTLQSLSPQTSMIVVAVKFVEVPERLLEDPLKSAYGISRSDGQNGAVLSPAQMTEVLELLRANSNVQLLTSPNVATLSGRQAQIQSADVRTVVTGIKPEALIPPGVDSTNASGSEVFELKSVPFGPMLDIVPFVEADGVTVSLMAKASMIEFLGYRNTPSSGEVSAYVNGKEERVTLPLPQFRHRHISFNSRVRDGFTLVFGNPSDEHGHPVEHLGDGQKKLLVFITPTIIDPAGNRIHPEGVVPFQINSLSKRP